ncbi:hypothetical protein ACOMHN_004141 [Nucella lapillus]
MTTQTEKASTTITSAPMENTTLSIEATTEIETSTSTESTTFAEVTSDAISSSSSSPPMTSKSLETETEVSTDIKTSTAVVTVAAETTKSIPEVTTKITPSPKPMTSKALTESNTSPATSSSTEPINFDTKVPTITTPSPKPTTSSETTKENISSPMTSSQTNTRPLTETTTTIETSSILITTTLMVGKTSSKNEASSEAQTLSTVGSTVSSGGNRTSLLYVQKCYCKKNEKISQRDKDTAQKAAEEVKKKLKTPRTSSQHRKLNSAQDKRPSAQTLGCVGVVIMVVVISFFLLPDLLQLLLWLCRHCKKTQGGRVTGPDLGKKEPID